jgi:ferredoxin
VSTELMSTGTGPATPAVRRRDLRDLLYDNLEHPRWDDVAGRCLACGNCTMVCPTCFCFSVEEVTDLPGAGGGRCIAWCPVGIDITEEVGAIAADD